LKRVLPGIISYENSEWWGQVIYSFGQISIAAKLAALFHEIGLLISKNGENGACAITY